MSVCIMLPLLFNSDFHACMRRLTHLPTSIPAISPSPPPTDLKPGDTNGTSSNADHIPTSSSFVTASLGQMPPVSLLANSEDRDLRFSAAGGDEEFDGVTRQPPRSPHWELFRQLVVDHWQLVVALVVVLFALCVALFAVAWCLFRRQRAAGRR